MAQKAEEYLESMEQCLEYGGILMQPDIENDEFGVLLNEAFPEIHDFGIRKYVNDLESILNFLFCRTPLDECST